VSGNTRAPNAGAQIPQCRETQEGKAKMSFVPDLQEPGPKQVTKPALLEVGLLLSRLCDSFRTSFGSRGGRPVTARDLWGSLQSGPLDTGRFVRAWTK
jgi:hypothetical protein